MGLKEKTVRGAIRMSVDHLMLGVRAVIASWLKYFWQEETKMKRISIQLVLAGLLLTAIAIRCRAQSDAGFLEIFGWIDEDQSDAGFLE